MYPLFFRLTIDVAKEEVMSVFKSFPERYLKGIFGEEEEANRKHLHCFVLTNEENSKNSRQNLKNILIKNYPQLKGNKDYAITKCSTDVAKIPLYCVKEGVFCYYNYSDEEITEFVCKSFTKPTPKIDYRKELQKLEDLLFDDKNHITFENFIDSFYELNSKYKKIRSFFQIQNYFEMVAIRKYPSYKRKLVETHVNIMCKRIQEWEEIVKEDKDRGFSYSIKF